MAELSPKRKWILETHIKDLTSRIIFSSLLDPLIAGRVITPEEKDDLQAKQVGDHAKVRSLILDYVYKKPDATFDKFLAALELDGQEHIAKFLRNMDTKPVPDDVQQKFDEEDKSIEYQARLDMLLNELADKLGNCGEKLGIELGVPYHKMQQLRDEHWRMHAYYMAMLHEWANKRQPVSKLVDALNKIQRGDLTHIRGHALCA